MISSPFRSIFGNGWQSNFKLQRGGRVQLLRLCCRKHSEKTLTHNKKRYSYEAIPFFPFTWLSATVGDACTCRFNVMFQSNIPHFKNNEESFRAILIKIKEFAEKLEYDYYANVFQKSLDFLSGTLSQADRTRPLRLPEIPEENLRLFIAANEADVFGAMGSWNDSTPGLAHEKGLDEEYEALSQELLQQVRLAFLYAINEW